MKKIFSLITSLLLLCTIVIPTLVSAQEETATTATTAVTLTKVVSESVLKEKGHDGSELNIQDRFGTGASYINGAKFNISKITAAEYEAWVADNKEVPTKLTETSTQVTAGSGSFTLNLEDGYYWISEDKSWAAANGIDSYIASDFALGLPLMDKDGNRMDTVHLYPKNTTSTEVDKTVTDLTSKTDGFAIGETITYWVTAKIPAGELNKFQFVDTLSDGLTYKKNVSAYIAETGTKDPADIIKGTSLIPLVSQDGQVITFDLAASLTDIKANAGKTVYLKYDVEINKDAAIATNLPNDVKLVYKREGSTDTDKEEKPDENPNVYTGGKKFIKQDPVKKAKLKGAEFVIKNTEEQFMKQDLDTLAITWVADQKSATKLVSDAYGKFEVKGLDFGATKETLDKASMDYILIEVKAPEGYVIPASLREGLKFTVNMSSYGETEIELGTNPTGTLVNNNKEPNIPNTGGIGSLIFIVIGLIVMGGSYVGYKKLA